MLIFVAFLCFFGVCGVLWYACFPNDYGFMSMPSFTKRPLRFVRRHAWKLITGLLLCSAPPVAVWLFSEPGAVPAFDTESLPPDPLVAALLKGEQLAPPAPLPPLAFSTEEVELVRPMLAQASRQWTQLDPDFSQRLLLVFKKMKDEHGYDMVLLEGYRSPERQNLLAAMGNNVTNARAFQSYHQYGLAADCAFWRDGKLVISEKDTWAMRGYQLYGQAVEALGLTWGGRWTMMDFGHTELRKRKLAAK